MSSPSLPSSTSTLSSVIHPVCDFLRSPACSVAPGINLIKVADDDDGDDGDDDHDGDDGDDDDGDDL